MSEPNPCFGCGGGNPRGMQLVFERDESASASSADSGWARNTRAGPASFTAESSPRCWTK